MTPEKTNEFNIFKIVPWVVLVSLVLLLFYLWPRGENVKTKSRIGKESTEAAASTATPASSSAQAQIVSDMLNFRAKPSLGERSIIGTISKGTVVKLIERQDKWLKVELSDGRIGYVSADPKFVKIINPPNQ